MKRLRHPVRAIREPFGTAGLIIAMVALVAALGGSALAAKGALTGKQKKEVEKIAKKYSGKRGPRGKNGQNGQNGTNGSPGAPGAKGDKGDAGGAGIPGPAGPVGPQGIQGPQGLAGAAGEAGVCSQTNPICKTPSKATLTGVWAASNGTTAGGNSPTLSTISFPLRVSPAPKALVTWPAIPGFTLGQELKNGNSGPYGPAQELNTQEEVEEDEAAFLAACPGNVAEPKAAPGFLCIYEGAKNGTGTTQLAPATAEEAHEFGIVVPWQIGAESGIRGTWAVTAG